jgi:aspartate-semialdehyde dehydrogenase
MPKKLRAGILAATATVGQRFIELLANHPNFEITALAASSASAGKTYREAWAWQLSSDPLPHVAQMVVQECTAELASVLFAPTKRAIANRQFASAGHKIFTNASAHRMQARGIVYGESASRNQNHYQRRKRTRAGSSAPGPRRIAPTLATARGGDAPDQNHQTDHRWLG